jgi:hypothetical protein
MLAVLLLAAEEAAEPSKTPFYILATALVASALILAFIGTARHETFPRSRGVQTAIIGVAVLLVAGTMVTAVLTG